MMNTEITKQIPTLVKRESPAQESFQELAQLLTKPARNFHDFMQTIALGGGTDSFSHPVKALPVFRTSLTSGYNYALETKMIAYVRFGVTTSNYFVVQSMILDATPAWVSHYYSADGKYAFSEGPISHTFAEAGETLMEANCPILNHIYNILAVEYVKTKEGVANTKLTHTLELALRRIGKTRSNELSMCLGIKDQAITTLNNRLMSVEMDPVYNWKERLSLFKTIKSERSVVIHTKKRAHRTGLFLYTFPLIAHDFKSAFVRFGKRPLDNALGVLEKLILDPIRWFGNVVRENMGYSIALAIYSPFTYFFITQPMNPHAMWAVGNVRSAYIQTTDTIKHLFVGGTAASFAETHESGPKKNYSELKPQTSNFLLSSDVPELSSESWEDRMSNFKAMQIAYEGNMEVAPRIGRLEQMETQLNWPLIVESTWLETERYSDFLNFLDNNSKDYTPNFVNFVHAEKLRTDQAQLYLWDKNVRFILDHKFTMMDQSSEQTQMDYYVGRSFVLLRDMTNSLAIKHKGLPLPGGYDTIMKLAQKFDADYKSGGSVLDRLKNNSKVFSQNDKTSTLELRSYMKRQWEVLYLLQNHTQEASNFGLQLYIWSVRNAIWSLQSFYSTKREELSMISMNFKKGNVVNKLSNNIAFKHIDSQYEALFHMMILEWASVRKEIGEALNKDIESVQRKQILDNVESFLKERDLLLKGANLI